MAVSHARDRGQRPQDCGSASLAVRSGGLGSQVDLMGSREPYALHVITFRQPLIAGDAPHSSHSRRTLAPAGILDPTRRNCKTLGWVILVRIGKGYPESLAEQSHVPPVGLIWLIAHVPGLIRSAHRLFFRCQASYLSTVDRSDA